MIKRVLVTGGTGVTGNALVRYLLNKKIEVTVLLRPGSARRYFLPEENKELTIVECEMENYTSADRLLADQAFDVFFHLAWDGSMGSVKVDNRNNFKLQLNNVRCALEAVELCSRLTCPVFVMTGSQAEYGRKSCKITEDMVKTPENAYGMAKLCAESMTRKQCQLYGIRHIWAILFSVYGPCDGTQSLIDTGIRKLLNGQSPQYTKGEQQWDYLYSYDAAKALLLLAEKGRDQEAYHVAYGRTAPLHEYIIAMHREVNPAIEPEFGVVPYGSEQIMYLGADTDKLVRDTGFRPEYTFQDGISEIKKIIQKGK